MIGLQRNACKRNEGRKRFWPKIGAASTHLFLIILSFFMLLPIIWSFLTSIKPLELINKYPPVIIPTEIVYKNYIRAYTSQPLLRFVGNSLFLALSCSVVSLIIAVLAAYAFSRYDFKGKKYFLFFILLTMMIPGITNLIPIYTVYSRLKLINNYLGLIIIYLPGLLPFAIWVMKSYLDSVQVELEEAAFIDGCNRIDVVTRIVVPLAVPGIVAVTTINFVAIWNEFLIALLFTSQKNMRTMTVGIYNFIGFTTTDQGAVNAAAFSALFPVLIIFLLVRDKFMQSLMEGAIKG